MSCHVMSLSCKLTFKVQSSKLSGYCCEAGFAINRRQEQAVVTAVTAAQQIPDSSVELVDSTGQVA